MLKELGLTIGALASAVISLWLGSVEYRMRKIREDLDRKANQEDIAKLIDLKQEVIKQVAQDTREDVKELKDKVDKLIELQLKGK